MQLHARWACAVIAAALSACGPPRTAVVVAPAPGPTGEHVTPHSALAHAVGRHEWHRPEVFHAEMAQRMDRLEREIVEDVQQGDAPPTAIEVVRAWRAHVMNQIGYYAQDGYIHADERDRVGSLVERAMDASRARYPVPPARGGGPYVPGGYVR